MQAMSEPKGGDIAKDLFMEQGGHGNPQWDLFHTILLELFLRPSIYL